MNRCILALALVALAMPAYAQGSKADAMVKKAPTTVEFAKKAEMTNMFEIQAGKLAQEKSDNSRVDSYARMIVQDHQKAEDDLKSKVQTIKNVELPSKLDAEHQKLIDNLKAASGAKFLRTFKTQQVKGHQQGVALFQGYADKGDNAALKQWAKNTVATLQKHLTHAQALPTTAPAPTTGSNSMSK